MEEVQVPGVTEGTEPQQTEQEAPPAPETVPFKWKDEEKALTASNVDSLASELGTSRDALLMQLQQARDYGHWVNENKRRERELAEREAQVDAYLQQIESQRSQAQQPTQQPQGLPQTDDPIALLRWQAEQIQAINHAQQEMRQEFAQEREVYQQQVRERFEEQHVQMANEAYNQVVTELKSKYPHLNAPSHEEIVDEMIQSGMAQNRRLSYAEGYRRAARNILWEPALQNAERQAVERMRSPKATVTIPGSGSAPRQPQEKPKSDIEAMLGDMKVSDLNEILPTQR